MSFRISGSAPFAVLMPVQTMRSFPLLKCVRKLCTFAPQKFERVRIVKILLNVVLLLAVCGFAWASPVDSVTESQVAARLWRAILEMHPLSPRNQVVVPPLIQTCWDQDEYYNILCPSDSEGQGNHVLTGCVATAMAQVMRYWEYPAQGTGSHSYSCDYGTLSADFGNSTYHYDMMPDRLSAGTPAAQVQEVAKLIYHCGVSVDMDYGPESSGSYLSLSPNALHTYFGYGMSSYIHKNQYSASSWNDIIKNQLDSLRPVLYRGQSDAGGHAFVCDGYDDQDYFHFNWGWNGSNNGYYLLSGLTPGNHNYNSSQAAVIGLFVDKPRLITSVKSQMLCIQPS